MKFWSQKANKWISSIVVWNLSMYILLTCLRTSSSTKPVCLVSWGQQTIFFSWLGKLYISIIVVEVLSPLPRIHEVSASQKYFPLRPYVWQASYTFSPLTCFYFSFCQQHVSLMPGCHLFAGICRGKCFIRHSTYDTLSTRLMGSSGFTRVEELEETGPLYVRTMVQYNGWIRIFRQSHNTYIISFPLKTQYNRTECRKCVFIFVPVLCAIRYPKVLPLFSL